MLHGHKEATMNNSTSANARGVRTYGLTLASLLVVAAMGILTALAVQYNKCELDKAYQRKLASKQRQIDTLRKQVSDLQAKVKKLSSRSGGLLTSKQLVPWKRVKLTWYSSLQGINGGYITATGTHVRDGHTVAVDPNVIPLGSVVEIRFRDGTTHTYVAEDTGGAVRGQHIDIFNSDNDECLRNGVQWAEYRIIYTPSH
jgi:3D (Asp-Asp-Asp) domain-containing protein/cell division protein FtsL